MRTTAAAATLVLATSTTTLVGVQGVHHFKELNGLHDLELLGVVNKDTQKAAKHMLLGFGNTNCMNDLRDLGFPMDYGSLGENFETGEIMLDRHQDLAQTYNISTDNTQICTQFVYVPKGGKADEDFDVLDAQDKVQLHNWLFEHLRLNVEVTNDLPYDVNVKWEDTMKRGPPQDLIFLPKGKTASVSTFESHHLRFYARLDGPNSKQQAFLRVRVDMDHPKLRLSALVDEEVATRQCSNPEDCETHTHTHTQTKEAEAEALLLAKGETNVNNAHGATDSIQVDEGDMNLWANRDHENKARLLRNEHQPQTKPRYTPLGFKKARVPEEAYKLMWNRYKTGERITEPWPMSDCHTNFYEAPSTMVYLTDWEKERIFAAMQPDLTEWAGGKTLIPTSCYGVRLYHNGSWLREHVDTGDTHIISAIMNIDQDVEEDWLLTFIDHNGDRHFITLEPGDALYYESASCLHGRPTPFKGNFFANTFVHFKVDE